MTAARTIVYVGPTLAADEVRARLPGADVRPPAGVGDILDVVRAARPVARIALIDGYFEGMAAVWHKELLLALERGIALYGAASMGALRAAELAPFGMIGAGAIYRGFARGTLIADDEVAVAHLPAAQGYRAVSDALVNLRHGLDGAVKARVISARTRGVLVEAARARFYRERTWARLLDDARGLVAAAQVTALTRWLATGPAVDLKAADARQLLGLIARERGGKRTPRRKLVVPRTWALRQLIAQR